LHFSLTFCFWFAAVCPENEAGVKAGGDRQELHEEIRIASMEAGAVVKGEGKPNDLLQRIKTNPKFSAVADSIDSMIDPTKFVGRAPEQVKEFIAAEIDPVLAVNADLLSVSNVDSVNV
jgi:adenylosuccinate lyase